MHMVSGKIGPGSPGDEDDSNLADLKKIFFFFNLAVLLPNAKGATYPPKVSPITKRR